MNKRVNTYKRKSNIALGELYFWTATISKWQKLLQQDEYKNVILQSLTYLTRIIHWGFVMKALSALKSSA